MTEKTLPPLKEKFLDLINKSEELLNSAFLFGQEQIPDIANQLLWYGTKLVIIYQWWKP